MQNFLNFVQLKNFKKSLTSEMKQLRRECAADLKKAAKTDKPLVREDNKKVIALLKEEHQEKLQNFKE